MVYEHLNICDDCIHKLIVKTIKSQLGQSWSQNPLDVSDKGECQSESEYEYW